MRDKGVKIDTKTPVDQLTHAQLSMIILHGLYKYFQSKRQKKRWVIFPELRVGTGFNGISKRRIDFFVINTGRGNETIAFEIKASKSDFNRDMRDDIKQRGARLFSNKFYYVTPKGLLDPKEIPVWAGLAEYDIEKNRRCPKNAHFTIKVPAPVHAKAMPSWGLICSMIRRIKKMEEDE